MYYDSVSSVSNILTICKIERKIGLLLPTIWMVNVLKRRLSHNYEKRSIYKHFCETNCLYHKLSHMYLFLKPTSISPAIFTKKISANLFIEKKKCLNASRLGSWLLKDLEEFSGRKLKKEAAKRQLLGNEMGDGHNSNEIPRNWIVGI